MWRRPTGWRWTPLRHHMLERILLYPPLLLLFPDRTLPTLHKINVNEQVRAYMVHPWSIQSRWPFSDRHWSRMVRDHVPSRIPNFRPPQRKDQQLGGQLCLQTALNYYYIITDTYLAPSCSIRCNEVVASGPLRRRILCTALLDGFWAARLCLVVCAAQ